MADPGPIPADLELGRLYVQDFRSLCSRINFATTRICAALMRLGVTQKTFQVLRPQFKMAANTWKIKIMKMPLNCNFGILSDKSKNY